jgi:hypothetical protein
MAVLKIFTQKESVNNHEVQMQMVNGLKFWVATNVLA